MVGSFWKEGDCNFKCLHISRHWLLGTYHNIKLEISFSINNKRCMLFVSNVIFSMIFGWTSVKNYLCNNKISLKRKCDITISLLKIRKFFLEKLQAHWSLDFIQEINIYKNLFFKIYLRKQKLNYITFSFNFHINQQAQTTQHLSTMNFENCMIKVYCIFQQAINIRIFPSILKKGGSAVG